MATSIEYNMVLKPHLNSAFVDTGVVRSYSSDAVARLLRSLATSFTEDNEVYVDEYGYIVYREQVYVPFPEAKRVFWNLNEYRRNASCEELAILFTESFYSPRVEIKDMREWFEWLHGSPP